MIKISTSSDHYVASDAVLADINSSKAFIRKIINEQDRQENETVIVCESASTSSVKILTLAYILWAQALTLQRAIRPRPPFKDCRVRQKTAIC